MKFAVRAFACWIMAALWSSQGPATATLSLHPTPAALLNPQTGLQANDQGFHRMNWVRRAGRITGCVGCDLATHVCWRMPLHVMAKSSATSCGQNQRPKARFRHLQDARHDRQRLTPSRSMSAPTKALNGIRISICMSHAATPRRSAVKWSFEADLLSAHEREAPKDADAAYKVAGAKAPK